MVEVKICGLTRPEDAVEAARLGVEHLGLVFAPSRRQVSLGQAAAIRQALGAAVSLVGVFVDPAPDDVRRAVEAAALGAIQVHGTARRPLGTIPGVRWWLGRRVRGGELVEPVGEGPWDLLLLDTWVEGQAGGTGRAFDWRAARPVVDAWRGSAPPRRLGVAGGLTPGNVAAAIAALRPDVVDVSSGVEVAPGHKDRKRMEEFVTAVRTASRTP